MCTWTRCYTGVFNLYEKIKKRPKFWFLCWRSWGGVLFSRWFYQTLQKVKRKQLLLLLLFLLIYHFCMIHCNSGKKQLGKKNRDCAAAQIPFCFTNKPQVSDVYISLHRGIVFKPLHKAEAPCFEDFAQAFPLPTSLPQLHRAYSEEYMLKTSPTVIKQQWDTWHPAEQANKEDICTSVTLFLDQRSLWTYLTAFLKTWSSGREPASCSKKQ